MSSTATFFKGDDLHAAYDTRQVFVPDPLAVAFTQLSPNYFTAAPARVTWWTRLRSLLGAKRAAGTQPRLPLVPKPKLPAVDLLMRLPPDRRTAVWRRLQALGAIDSLQAISP